MHKCILGGLSLSILALLCSTLYAAKAGNLPAHKTTLADLQAKIETLQPERGYPDDVYALVVIKEALAGLQGKSGGIGACLVDERTGEVIERGHNRQYTGYFRSDLHAEMDLLTRYEDRLKKLPAAGGGNPRACEGLVLYTSVEPCPMCLTRIINSGIKKMYYVAADKDGGMATRMDSLPPFWRKFAQDRVFGQAKCSPAMRSLAGELFEFSLRSFKPK